MHDLAVMETDRFRDEVEVAAQNPMGGVLIVDREPAVTGHIRVQNRGQFARQTVFHSKLPPVC